MFTLGRFILTSVNFSEFHKNKFSVYFILANSWKIVGIHAKISKNFISILFFLKFYLRKFPKITKLKWR